MNVYLDMGHEAAGIAVATSLESQSQQGRGGSGDEVALRFCKRHRCYFCNFKLFFLFKRNVIFILFDFFYFVLFFRNDFRAV